MSRGKGLIFKPDMRRALYRMGDYLREQTAGTALPDSLTLERGAILDQGEENTCVGHAWCAWYNCKPRGHLYQFNHSDALFYYDEATRFDGYPGNEGDRQSGTTTAAGAKVAVERSYASSYVWASTLDEISAFIRSGKGPVVVGADWYYSMEWPDANGFVHVKPSSGLGGGHEWLVYGVQSDGVGGRYWVCQNSWGEDFADGGQFYVMEAGMQKLLSAGMEAASMVQTGIEPR